MTRNHLHFLLLLAAFTLAYVLTGMLGLSVRTGHEGITPIWPPSGIALYAFLRFGPRMWPVIVIGIFTLGWQYSIPLPSVIIAAFGNTCEALLGWYLCRRFNIELGKRLGDTWRFLLLPVLVAPLAGASIGSVGMVLGGAADWQAVPFMWMMWWLGDACGILLFTPLLFAWVRRPAWFHSRPRLFEWVIVTGFSVFLGWYSFVFEEQYLPGQTVDIMFLVTPFLLWASIRMGLRGATLVSLIACCWVLWGAVSGTGPLALDNAMIAGMIESSFILVITLTALVVQALFREHMLDMEEIRKSNEALTERVRLRTAELERMNEALKVAKESAEQANASKTRFLVAASHDLRQPLQVLTTHTDMLGMQEPRPETAASLEQLRIAGRTMRSIVDMLVDITRLETGDIPRDIRVFPVSLLLEELRKQHTLPATEKNLSFRVNNCDRHVRSDYNLLRLILQNLISNAIRYTDSGTIEVNCIARDDMLRIAVTDTGIGIPDTERQMIFEEFYQIDNPARERGRGMGMGLAIVRRLAALLDHPLHLQSVPGEGSTFAIEVPLENATGATRGTPAVPVIRTVAVTGTILLVDDDPTVLQSLQMLLESMGFRVYTAENAAAAVQLVSSHEQSPDLIISDYRLPDSASGTTLVRELRDASGRHIPAIILTGDITLTGLEDSFTNSMLLGKPVLSVDLEQAIQRLLGKDSKPGTPD